MKIWLKIKGSDDMVCDKWFWDGGIVILADFVGILKDIDKVKFWRKSVDESAIGSAVFPCYLFSFCHPLHHRSTVFLHFSVVIVDIEQIE